MARAKDQRGKGGRKCGGGGTGAAGTHKRGKQQQCSQLHLHLHHALLLLLALVLIFILVPVFYPKQLPIIGVEDARDNSTGAAQFDRVLSFLDNFVCDHKPIDTNSKVDAAGYCHPMLQSSPESRTQIVSSSRRSSSATQLSLKYTVDWWRDALVPNFSDGIAAGDHIMTLPRPLQIWDLDALRDEFIQQHFLGFPPDGSTKLQRKQIIALHKETNNPLDSGAYLAVHLLRLLHGSQQTHQDMGKQCAIETDECISDESSGSKLVSWTDTKQHSERLKILRDYLDILPTYDDRKSRSSTSNMHEHPIVWNKATLESLFPKYTQTYNLIISYQSMVQSEYNALKSASPDEYNALKSASPDEFGRNVNFTEYLGMRINVLSRAFSAMVSANDVGPSWNAVDHTNHLPDEVKSYTTSNFGDSFSVSDEFKFRSMCPLLDMYNSHPNPNVMWRYDTVTSSYSIHANNDGIPTGHEIIVSYGKYTEGHLFAKYGYVNGDGSSKTEVSLNVFHRILGDVGLSFQYSPLAFHAWDKRSDLSSSNPSKITKHTLNLQYKEMLRYLMFDDGHKECILFEDDDGSLTQNQELKLLKFQHMKRLANIGEAWMVRLPARFPNAQHIQGNTVPESPPQGDESRVGIDAKRILSLCRLLSLTTDDINGDAIGYLREGLSISYSRTSLSKQPYFQVDKHENTLEYRSLMCVARLSDIAFRRYGKYVHPNGNTEPSQSRLREWTSWYIRDGEMRLLSIIRQTALSEANRLKNRHNLSGDGILMRERACPIESSMPILQIEA